MSDDRTFLPPSRRSSGPSPAVATTDDQRATTFARGLALGALVGAAIAGSTIWQRRQTRQMQRAEDAPGPVALADPASAAEAETRL